MATSGLTLRPPTQFAPPYFLARGHPISYDATTDTLTFLFTDIEGSTSLLRRVGSDTYAKILEHHHVVVRDSLRAHHGEEQGTQGDSFFAVFRSPSAAVVAAVEIQRRIAHDEWPDGERPRVRMGLHTGEVVETTTGLVGYEVHRAARIAAVGHGGQVLLSAASAGLVEDSLPEEMSLKDLGTHRLKDLGRPETIFQLLVPGLAQLFGPLKSLDNPELPNNLPASLSPFVGRARELAEVRALVLESRLITLTGAGGSGKTRLALQVAAELLDGTGEGVWFVDLAPVSSPRDVPTTVMDSLQLRPIEGLSPVESLLSILKEQRVLVIIDNCEHLVDAVADLCDAVGRRCSKVSLVATSREPLGVNGEQVYRVRSLSLPDEAAESVEELHGSDAVALFVARARSHDRTFALTDQEAPLVGALCRRLDGIPLAIELAAARLSTMSLQDLSQRLDQRFRLLTGGSRNALPRQQTLGAMVAWSYDLLSESERAVLRRLSVFVGGFDLRAAEAVCAGDGVEPYEVTDLVGSLVTKSLVGAERTRSSLRYQLLETIRQYAADQLIQVGGEDATSEVRRRHAEYYLHLCEESEHFIETSDQAHWLRQLDAEWDNVQAALNHFAQEGDGGENILRVAAATREYLMSRQDRVVWRHLDPLLESAPMGDRRLWARALTAAGAVVVFSDAGLAQRGYERLVEATSLARELDDVSLLLAALRLRSTVAHLVGRREEAIAHAIEAIELARATGSRRDLALGLLSLVLCDIDRGDAADLEHEALALFRETGDLLNQCNCLVFLSISVGVTVGRVDVALDLSIEAMAIAEEIGSTFHHQLLHMNLGLSYFLLGDLDEAERYSRISALSCRRQGVGTAFLFWVVFNFALCATARGELQRGALLMGAHDALEKALTVGELGHWSELELAARANYRRALIHQLGDEALSQLAAQGAALNVEDLLDLCLHRGRFAE